MGTSPIAVVTGANRGIGLQVARRLMAAGHPPVVSEGAASAVWSALLADGGPRGGFFRDGRPLPW